MLLLPTYRNDPAICVGRESGGQLAGSISSKAWKVTKFWVKRVHAATQASNPFGRRPKS
jgi:hypothetical protein